MRDSIRARLAKLRGLCVPETIDEARDRLEREARIEEPFAKAVARRLEELRALCELADHLHGARVDRG
jgi:hypothetical protein